jgi:hypothetical protein
MFECYNLLDSMEWGVTNFEVDFQQQKLQDPMVISLNSYIFN